MAMLIKLQRPKEKAIEAMRSWVKWSLASRLRNRQRAIMAMHITTSNKQPKKPNSSAHRAKTKSVLCSGRYSRWVWVPKCHPLPRNPPEPIAILA